MQESPVEYWQEALRARVKDPLELQRLAAALGKNPVTLNRWASGKTHPRPYDLQLLLVALQFPPQEAPLPVVAALKEEREHAVSATIPADFYAKVHQACATTSALLRFPSICRMIVQQVLGHLDSRRLGLSVTLVCCVPPTPQRGDLVLCLRERIGRGTLPWRYELDQHALFLGAESVAGFAVSSGYPAIVPNMDEQDASLSFARRDFEMSSAAFPIRQARRVAGCLLILSVQVDFLRDAEQRLLAQAYADLAALAFDDSQFFDIDRIALRRMPPATVQQEYLSRFRQRVLELMMQGELARRIVTLEEAEEVVLQQLVDDLLSLEEQLE